MNEKVCNKDRDIEILGSSSYITRKITKKYDEKNKAKANNRGVRTQRQGKRLLQKNNIFRSIGSLVLFPLIQEGRNGKKIKLNKKQMIPWFFS